MKAHYIHSDVPELSSDFLKESDVLVKTHNERPISELMGVAILSMKLARLIGVQSPRKPGLDFLPYDPNADNVVFPAPLASALVGRRINLLRGWKQFESCIKGANALGLMAEHVQAALQKLGGQRVEQIVQTKKAFLRTRMKPEGNREAVFSEDEIEAFSVEQLSAVGLLELATWMAFGAKTIVCSTSSNMGISLHDALRSLQKKELSLKNKKFTLFNTDEGKLIIWCPAADADFMNPEKSAFLRELESQQPKLTTLKTYINRQQRDPGALKDALLCGGVFFPTNPQSKDELQNLLFVSLTNIGASLGKPVSALLEQANIAETLAGLKAECAQGKVYVTQGIEGGIAGLMVPYLLLLEELLPVPELKAISTWNQASIGAALAAAVLADGILRKPEELSEQTRSDLNSLFPNISRFLDHKQFGKDLLTSVHGVFDIANMQSLAQLLGVVVEKHLSGRATAYVGLGSSSYSNGNRCYEILKRSFDGDGPFRGKQNFHPATHAVNPFAQALVYGEDVHRCLRSEAYRQIADSQVRLDFVRARVRKPEPAGATALAGYLLARLDSSTLSLVEIAYAVRLMGFSKNNFLTFLGHSADEQGSNKLLQECYEEGPYMGDLVKNIMVFMDWPIDDLRKKASKERVFSRLKYILSPLDPAHHDNLDPHVTLYLTGDNTRQPGGDFLQGIIEAQTLHAEPIKEFLDGYEQERRVNPAGMTISIANVFLAEVASGLKNLNDGFDRFARRVLNKLVSRQMGRLK